MTASTTAIARNTAIASQSTGAGTAARQRYLRALLVFKRLGGADIGVHLRKLGTSTVLKLCGAGAVTLTRAHHLQRRRLLLCVAQ